MAPVSGPIRRYGATCATPATSSQRLHVLTRADCTTRNVRKAERLAAAYDELEDRIARLSQEEELAAMRPDLDGRQIMAILGLEPGPLVGEAYHYLLRAADRPRAPR